MNNYYLFIQVDKTYFSRATRLRMRLIPLRLQCSVKYTKSQDIKWHACWSKNTTSPLQDYKPNPFPSVSLLRFLFAILNTTTQHTNKWLNFLPHTSTLWALQFPRTPWELSWNRITPRSLWHRSTMQLTNPHPTAPPPSLHLKGTVWQKEQRKGKIPADILYECSKKSAELKNISS